MEVWFPHLNVTRSGNSVTHWLGLINGYDAPPVTGSVTVHPNAWNGMPMFVFDGLSALQCTAANLLSPYAGDDKDLFLMFGMSVTAFSASKTLGGLQNALSGGFGVATNTSSSPIYYRGSLQLATSGGGSMLGPLYLSGENVGIASVFRANLIPTKSGDLDTTTYTPTQFVIGGKWRTDTLALTQGFVGKIGPVIVCDPTTVDRSKLLKLLRSYGYGPIGLFDTNVTSAWIFADTNIATAVMPIGVRWAATQDLLSGSAATEGVAIAGDAMEQGTNQDCLDLKSIFGVLGDVTGVSETLSLFMPVDGNHDHDDADAETYRAANFTYEQANQDAAGCYSYVSARGGNIRWINCNVSVAEADVSGQATFVAAQLAATTQPWNFVVYHYGEYCADNMGSTAVPSVLAIVQATEDSGENVFRITGHRHIWERSYPMHDGVRDDNAKCVYIVAGVMTGSGTVADPDKTDTVTWGLRTDNTDAANWCASVLEQSGSNGVLRVIATPTTLWLGYYQVNYSVAGAGDSVVLLDEKTYTAT